MANRLLKEIRYVYDRGQEGYSATSQRVYQVRQVLVPSSGPGYAYGDDYYVNLNRSLTAARGGDETLVPYNSLTRTGGFWVFRWPARPAQPYIAPSIKIVSRSAWDAKGDSIFSSEADFSFSFDYARYPNGGLMAGLSNKYIAGAGTPADIVVGVMVLDGPIQVVGGGITLATAPYESGDKPAISVLRDGTKVVVSVADWTYEAEAGLTDRAFVRAMLFAPGDFIDNPVISFPVKGTALGGVGVRVAVPDFARARGGLGVRLKSLRSRSSIGFGGSAVAWVDINAKAKGATAFTGRLAKPGADGLLRLPGLSVFGGQGMVSAARLTLPKMRATGDGGFFIVPGGGAVLALQPPSVVRGEGLTGFIGVGDVTMRAPICGGGDYAYGWGRTEINRLQAYGIIFEPDLNEPAINLRELVEYATFGTIAQPQLSLFAAIREQVDLSVELSLTALFTADMFEALSVHANTSVAAMLSAILTERVVVSDAIDNIKKAAVQYATNVLTGAVSRYEGFDFVGFANIGQDTYAAAENGIYRVAHGTQPLEAAIEFAAIGTGSGNGKRLDSILLGLDTDGTAFLRVTGDDGRENTYKAVGRGGMMRGQTAKGVKSRHWDVRMEIVDATVIDLDRIEWLMPVSARRY